MNVIKAGYEILTPISDEAIKEMQLIERAARTCYQSEDRITEDGSSALKIIKTLLNNKHESVIEHSFLSVCFTVDRGVSHEAVRHRLTSVSQSSTRYCNYANDKFGNEITVIDIENGIALDKKMQKLPVETISLIIEEWYKAMEDAERHYMKMINLGATPQIARSVLPHSTKTSLVITTNYREWRTILKLRTAKDAHPQIRGVMISLARELADKIPILFDDIVLDMEK